MINESSLAKELCSIFTDLSIKGESYVVINGWLKLNLLISPTETCVTCSEYQSLLFYDFPKRLEPYVHDKSQNTLLGALLKKCKYPICSFSDIAESEGVTFKAVSNAALHFVRWNKAKLVSCFNDESLFVNSSNFSFSKELIMEYDKVFKFKTFEGPKSFESSKAADLAKIIVFFSSPKSIKAMEKMSITKAKAIPLITWMMRKEILQDVHYYIYLIYKTPEQIASLNDNSEEYSTLQKLLLYTDGKLILEDILHKTSLKFQDVKNCSKRFKKYFKMVIH